SGPPSSVSGRGGVVWPVNPPRDRPDGLVADAVRGGEVAQAVVPGALGDRRPQLGREPRWPGLGSVPTGPAAVPRPQHPLGVEERDEGRVDDVYLAEAIPVTPAGSTWTGQRVAWRVLYSA